MLKKERNMTFSQFLKQSFEEDSKIGDLARDFIASKCKATSYEGVKRSLDKHNACCEAYNALELAYELYKKRI